MRSLLGVGRVTGGLKGVLRGGGGARNMQGRGWGRGRRDVFMVARGGV